MYRLKDLVLTLFCLSLLLIPIDAAQSKEKETDAPALKAEVEEVIAAPQAKEGKATAVKVDLAILDISNVFDKEQRISADVFLKLTWKDPRLVEKVEGEGSRAKVEDVWTPNVQIINDVGLVKKMEDVVDVQPNGVVTYKQRYVGDISERLQLQQYPRDQHTFKITVAITGETLETIALIPGDMMYFPVQEDITVEDWTFTPGELNATPLTFKGHEGKVPGFTYSFEGKRKIGFYIWTLIVPLSVIVFMSWAVFWLDPIPELFGPQVGIATTSMLTVIAFRFILVNFVPKVSYMTRMDRFLLGAIVFVFLALVEVIATSNLAKRGHVNVAKGMDWFCRFLFPVAFVVLILFSFVF